MYIFNTYLDWCQCFAPLACDTLRSVDDPVQFQSNSKISISWIKWGILFVSTFKWINLRRSGIEGIIDLLFITSNICESMGNCAKSSTRRINPSVMRIIMHEMVLMMMTIRGWRTIYGCISTNSSITCQRWNSAFFERRRRRLLKGLSTIDITLKFV